MPRRPGRLKFLVDECIGLPTLTLLRELGYSVVTAKEANLGGKSDLEILKYSIKEGIILITEDIDFGNILLYPPKLHHGVILLRFRHSLEVEIHASLLKALRELKPADLKETLIIVDADKYRIRKE